MTLGETSVLILDDWEDDFFGDSSESYIVGKGHLG